MWIGRKLLKAAARCRGFPEAAAPSCGIGQAGAILPAIFAVALLSLPVTVEAATPAKGHKPHSATAATTSTASASAETRVSPYTKANKRHAEESRAARSSTAAIPAQPPPKLAGQMQRR